MSTLIKAEHLYRYYGPHCAVNDLSFTLEKGEILGLLGPNGAGKTSTLQMLCGQLAPSAGQITINAYDLLDSPKQAKRHLGYLPDTPPLYRELTVDEFLLYCARLHKIPRAGTAKALARVKNRCGLNDVSDRLIGNLSKGYQQRIGIAQAILHNPAIIILDEPTVGLDPIQIREIRSLIKELGQDHGIILSTHILSEVQESCTQVQIIQQGRLILNETIAGLNKHMNTASLELMTRAAPDYNTLKAIPGVISVEGLSYQRTRIHFDTSQNPAEHIAETVVNLGWGLLEMTPLKKSMEDIFIALTETAQIQNRTQS
ncbi:MAG: ABC transporter ATP-binding protein [Gammaproteobacteria bacterium HGW-Gammaproteobacteria-10]|nr:MAG: ABC transporter ATP-binding protein [Gammaproteobacteria bacterium HGW-Gammaproteobacteria-3]PKM35573.1 MAG: ABC transporter ATP-binding protein [Gammaproteobacteria bacterium HGW-Gammaproteobacteria-10]